MRELLVTVRSSMVRVAVVDQAREKTVWRALRLDAQRLILADVRAVDAHLDPGPRWASRQDHRDALPGERVAGDAPLLVVLISVSDVAEDDEACLHDAL